VGLQFEPKCLHHAVFRYRTRRVIRAVVPQIAGFSSSSSSLRQSRQTKKAEFDPPSLHRKIPFPTRISETGSMTGWWVISLSPTNSAIQSPQTTRFSVDPKQAVSGGFPVARLKVFGFCRCSRLFVAIVGARGFASALIFGTSGALKDVQRPASYSARIEHPLSPKCQPDDVGAAYRLCGFNCNRELTVEVSEIDAPRFQEDREQLGKSKVPEWLAPQVQGAGC
jgi:hypothetical protein